MPFVGAVLIRLTAKSPAVRPRLGLPTVPGGGIEPTEILLANLDAAAVIAAVESGELPPAALPWVVLMNGAGDPALAERWKQAVLSREPDEERRLIYRDVALTFAELTRGLVIWQRALGGWLMKESVYVNQWVDAGVQKGELKKARADVLDVLVVRTGSPVPEPIRLAIEGTNDTTILNRWLLTAAAIDTYPDFQKRMTQP